MPTPVPDIKVTKVNGISHMIDFDGLANRPFGVVTSKSAYVAAMILNTEEGYAQGIYQSYYNEMDGIDLPEIGQLYTVTLDGVETNVVCALGDNRDHVLTDAEDLDDMEGGNFTFIIWFYLDYPEEGENKVVFMDVEAEGDPTATHTLKIEKAECTKLDHGYLPHAQEDNTYYCEVSYAEALNIVSNLGNLGIVFDTDQPK